MEEQHATLACRGCVTLFICGRSHCLWRALNISSKKSRKSYNYWQPSVSIHGTLANAFCRWGHHFYLCTNCVLQPACFAHLAGPGGPLSPALVIHLLSLYAQWYCCQNQTSTESGSPSSVTCE